MAGMGVLLFHDGNMDTRDDPKGIRVLLGVFDWDASPILPLLPGDLGEVSEVVGEVRSRPKENL